MLLQTPGDVRSVQHTREFARVMSIPRREWTEAALIELASELTALLRTPGGTMTLRPIQALALLEAGIKGGALGAIGVGKGKTLISLLAPYVLSAERPIILLPAKLIEKTKREARILSVHWRIPNYIRFCSYELLGRVQAIDLFDQYQPDFIFLDECHKAKNRKAACTKRVERYIKTHPGTRVIAVSGTITKRSLKDFAHITTWCLPANESPLPNSFTELEDWADALDEKTPAQRNIGVGALALLQNEEERATPDQLLATRRAFKRRLSNTSGVILSNDGQIDCSLTIEALWGKNEIIPSKAIDDAFKLLRETWKAPDGWPHADPMSVWRVARELSLGFFYAWDPRPPEYWASARREWAKVCRDILTNNRRNLDSELQVTNAVEDGKYPLAKYALEDWRKVKDTFVPNSVPVWIDDSVVKACALWAAVAPGIVWCEHLAFADRLAKHARLVYYGKKGQDSRGRPIESHPPEESLIASVSSNAEGRNLQHFNRNLITSFPPNGLQVEQLLGRTHREGQREDEVKADVVVTSIDQIRAFEQAVRDAQRYEAMMGPQKLLYADILMPSSDDVIMRPGHRWKK